MNHAGMSLGGAIGIAVSMLVGYGQLGFYIPFLYGLDAVRISADERTVRLRGLDSLVSSGAGALLCVASSLVLALGFVEGVIAFLIAAVAWFGFRVAIVVDAEDTRVVRTFLFVIPWRVQRCRGRAEAFTDGWGDFMDPLALRVRFGRPATQIELAWQGRSPATSGADRLARDFNAAVSRLRPTPPRRPYR